MYNIRFIKTDRVPAGRLLVTVELNGVNVATGTYPERWEYFPAYDDSTGEATLEPTTLSADRREWRELARHAGNPSAGTLVMTRQEYGEVLGRLYRAQV